VKRLHDVPWASVPVAALIVLGGGVLLAPHRSPHPVAAPASATAPAGPAGPGTLYYTDSGEDGSYNALWRRAVPGGGAKRLLLGNQHQLVGVVLGPGVRRLLFVNDERPDIGGDDFMSQPVMRLYDAEGTTYVTLGAGYDVALSPDGTRLAWLAPTRARTCTVDDPGCEEPPSVVKVARMDDLAHPRRWGPFDGLRGASWADAGRLLVYRRGGATSLFSPADGNLAPVELGGAVQDVSAATGRVLVRDGAQHVLRVAGLDGSTAWERRWPAEFVEGQLSPDGTTVLASVSRKTGLTAEERLVLVDVATGAERAVPGTGHVNGEKLWSTTGRSFGFRRETPDGERFELAVCPADLRTPCRVAHTWTAGLSILVLDG
jgi:hypothetical protein